VGRRVSVYWQDELRAYEAEVVAELAGRGLLLRYDGDGLVEWMAADSDALTWIPAGLKRRRASAAANWGQAVAVPRGKAAAGLQHVAAAAAAAEAAEAAEAAPRRASGRQALRRKSGREGR